MNKLVYIVPAMLLLSYHAKYGSSAVSCEPETEEPRDPIKIDEMVVSVTTTTLRPAQEDPTDRIDITHDCGLRLLHKVGKIGKASDSLPDLYRKYSVSKDEEFLEYMMAVIYVESAFNKEAHSNKDAIGLMQMTTPAVTDAVSHCNLRPVLDMKHLLDSATNIRYGTCYLKKLLDETDGDWTRALIAYNGGYKQLQKYDNGDTVTTESANYVLKVLRAIKYCRSVDTL